MEDKRQILIGAVILTSVVAIIGVFITQQAKPSIIKLESSEHTNMLILASTIAESKLRSPWFIEEKYINGLRSIAKRYNPNTDWFAKSTGEFRMERGETENKEVYTISDGLHCAEFTFQEKEKEYYLLKYSFERKKCDGSAIWSVTEEEYSQKK